MSNSDINSIENSKKYIKDLEMILDNFPGLIFYKDDKNNLIRVNKYMADAHETTKEALAGKNCFDIYPRAVAQKYFDDDLQVIKSKKPKLNFIEPWDIADKRRWVKSNKIPLFDDDGKCIGIIGFSTDVTEQITAQKKAEVEIVNLTRFTLENPNPVLRVTKDKVICANRASEELLNITKDDKLPELLRSLVYEADDEGISISSEIEFNKNNFFLNAIPIKEEAHVYIYGVDITAHKNVEIELRKTMEDLERSNNDLEQFASVASHDLQEPLRMVTGFTQLLRDRYKDKLDEDANDFINYAIDGATRMKDLIDDLLIYSRIGSRGTPFKLIEMNIALEIVLNNLGQLIDETCSVITSDPLPVIKADETQMIQLFQNLISNAIKFRGQKTPVIHVTAEIKTDMWIFSVQDNGIGIDNKYFDKIFIIFQRLHKKSEYDGTGIGLAVCKKIVQRHSGKIWVESELGKGSTFHFSIKKDYDPLNLA